jgi:long-chain acyl-CoA synthetase
VPIAHKVDVGGGDDLCYEDLAGRPGAEEQTRDLPDDAAGWLFYTSGTTGRPKGAVISHRNLVFVVVSWCADLYCLRADDVVLHCAPLSHGAGFHALAAVARGAQNLAHDRFDPELVLSDIARYRVTTSWLVPTQVRMLLDSPALVRADLSSVRALVYGGAPMHAVDLREAMTRFGPVLCQLYGQGESPMTISYLSADEHRLERADREVLNSAGVARTGMQITIIDAQATSVPVASPGPPARYRRQRSGSPHPSPPARSMRNQTMRARLSPARPLSEASLSRRSGRAGGWRSRRGRRPGRCCAGLAPRPARSRPRRFAPAR